MRLDKFLKLARLIKCPEMKTAFIFIRIFQNEYQHGKM